MPPIDSDPERQSLDRGLKSLEKPHRLADAKRMTIQMPLTLLIDDQGQVTEIGQQQMRMVAKQMQRLPLDVRLEVSDAGHVDDALELADELVSRGGIATFRVSVAIGESTSTDPQLLLRLTRTVRERGEVGT